MMGVFPTTFFLTFLAAGWVTAPVSAESRQAPEGAAPAVLAVEGAARDLPSAERLWKPEPEVHAEPDDPIRLSLDQAVRLALDTGEEVELVREQILQAEEEIIQVRSGAFPQVSTNLAYTRQIRSIFDDLAQTPGMTPGNGMGGEDDNPFADLPFGRPNTWVASLSINQTLYAQGQVTIGLDIAERVRSLLARELEETEAELRAEVQDAYFQAVFSDLLVEISTEAWELADRQLEEVRSFRERGLASEFDVLTARVERDNLRPGIVEAENGARLARQNLRRLVNIPRDREVELTTRLAAELTDVDRSALEAAVTDRPALQAAAEQIRIQEDQVRLARAGFRPSASAFAEFGYQAFPTSVLPGTDWREDWNVGLQVSIPLFTGFRRSAEVEGARSEVRSAQLERRRLEEGILLEFDGAMADFDAALAEVEARRGTVEQAARALELAELRFAAGSATALELSNARLNLQQARVNEAEGLLNYVQSLSRLERVTGGEVPLLATRIQATPDDSDSDPTDG